MTFEERIDRLAERHEALAQTVELHHAMLSRMEAIQQQEILANQHQREMLDGLLGAVDRLTRGMEQHESRIRNLESRSS